MSARLWLMVKTTMLYYSAAQSQKAVSTHFTSGQILPFLQSIIIGCVVTDIVVLYRVTMTDIILRVTFQANIGR